MIPYGKHHIDNEDIEAVVSVLKSGQITQGPKIEEFESEIAKYVGAKYAVAVSSGTAALHLAGTVSNLGPNNALITSPITFVASANAAFYNRSQVIFADIDLKSINMSADSLKKALKNNPKIKVVMPIHFAGLPCEMEAIKNISDKNNLIIVEDAAHALGATYDNGKKVGSCCYSDMTIFSFHPVKSIAAGEGGMITTNDEKIYRKLIRLRSHGINKLDDPYELKEQSNTNKINNPWYYEVQELGFHYRINDIQCALALSQLKKIDKFISKRMAIVKKYDDEFSTMKNIKPFQNLGRKLSSHHLYVVNIDFNSIGKSRAELMHELRGKDIICQVHYIPLPMHPYFRNLGFNPEEYPNSLNYYNNCLSIPLFYDLTDIQQDYVVKIFKELVG
mgnify:FL=1